jgi:hypothetical protein
MLCGSLKVLLQTVQQLWICTSKPLAQQLFQELISLPLSDRLLPTESTQPPST